MCVCGVATDLDEIGDGIPLLFGGVHAGGIVRAQMEEHHGAIGCLL